MACVSDIAGGQGLLATSLNEHWWHALFGADTGQEFYVEAIRFHAGVWVRCCSMWVINTILSDSCERHDHESNDADVAAKLDAGVLRERARYPGYKRRPAVGHGPSLTAIEAGFRSLAEQQRE